MRLRRDQARMSRSRAISGFVVTRFKLYFSELSELSWQERHLYLRSKVSYLKNKFGSRDPFKGNRAELDWAAVYRANKYAGRAYVASPYAGRVAVFWSQDRAVGSREHRAEWMSLLEHQIAAAEVPGTDSGYMLKPPNAEILAEKVAACFRLAQNG